MPRRYLHVSSSTKPRFDLTNLWLYSASSWSAPTWLSASRFSPFSLSHQQLTISPFPNFWKKGLLLISSEGALYIRDDDLGYIDRSAQMFFSDGLHSISWFEVVSRSLSGTFRSASMYFSKYKYKALQDFYCVQNRTPRKAVSYTHLTLPTKA